jgi:hypothetical protein
MSACCDRLSPPHRSSTIVSPAFAKIDAISRSDIEAQFPDTISTRFVIAEISCGDAIDASLDRDPRPHIFKSIEPVLIGIAARGRQKVANLVHGFFAFKRILSRLR